MPEAKKRKETHPATEMTPKQKHEQQQKRITTYTAIAVIIIVAIVVAYLMLGNRPTTVSRNPESVDFHYDRQPSLGEPDAPVKVVVFEDFKCPACKAFEEQGFPYLKQDYIDTGQVEFFFLNFQFIGPDSTTAGIAGECIYRQNEAAFWAYHRAIFERQGPESQQWATREFILNLVQERVQQFADVNVPALDQCITSQQYLKDVEEDYRIGIAAGVTGTPAIFVNKKKVERWWPYTNLREAIDQELKKSAP